MVQTGDPTSTGKGGESIWGGSFEDEIRSTLKVCTHIQLSLINVRSKKTVQRQGRCCNGQLGTRYEHVAVFHHVR